MIYTVTSTDEIDWTAKGPARVAQNVINLIKNKRYEVAYNRTMGINPEVFDRPASEIETILTNEVMDLVDLFEPRATVVSVRVLTVTDEGEVVVKVVLDI